MPKFDENANDSLLREAVAQIWPESDWLWHKARLKRESAFNPNARNKTSGALGIAQFMPKTAAQYGAKNEDDIKSPAWAIPAMIRYTRDIERYYKKFFPRVEGLALEMFVDAGYNWGQGNVLRTLRKYGFDWGSCVPHLPAETRLYSPTIQKFKTEYKERKT